MNYQVISTLALVTRLRINNQQLAAYHDACGIFYTTGFGSICTADVVREFHMTQRQARGFLEGMVAEKLVTKSEYGYGPNGFAWTLTPRGKKVARLTPIGAAYDTMGEQNEDS